MYRVFGWMSSVTVGCGQLGVMCGVLPEGVNSVIFWTAGMNPATRPDTASVCNVARVLQANTSGGCNEL
ncbi:hypothetical protein EYF80_001540 [Liparis tanakae]|uniref:Uncharacterized protein n=1 Tax=Liparis tanakae TaxID=230148 RepID=A0A4Z2JES3_9TELE|nr:hypothetical protein EYF80_001540 [Liparis tanakae]